jgi:brevianamide F synthase
MNSLGQSISEQNVNWAWSTPLAVRAIKPDRVLSLDTVALGGEAVTQDNAEIWAHRVNLVNGYGPAECTICTVFKILPH